MINKIKKWIYRSLYTQICVYLVISITVGIFSFLCIKSIGKYMLIKNSNLSQMAIQEKLDLSFYSLQDEISKNSTEIHETLDKWTYKNKYYILYLINDDGTLFYTNDGLNQVGDTEIFFPTEKLYQTTIDNSKVNISITYLYAAEMSSMIETISIVSGFVIAVLIFVVLFKGIVDRIKRISYQLEIISGGDSTVALNVQRNDEIGILVENINQMRTSLMAQYNQVEELEQKQYQKSVVLSHDIRTPLTVIKGYLEIIKNQKSYENMETYLSKFEEKINEIQDLSLRLFENIDEVSTKLNQSKEQDFMDANNFLNEIRLFEQNVSLSGFNLEVSHDVLFDQLNLSDSEFRQILTSVHSNLTNYAATKDPIIVDCKVMEDYLNITIVNTIDDSKVPFYSTKRGLALQTNMLRERKGDLRYSIDKDKFFLTISIFRVLSN